MKPPAIEVVRPRARLDHHTSAVDTVAVSADGSLMASASPDNGCALWDLGFGGVRKAELHCGPGKARVRGVAFDKKNKWLACASQDGGVYLWAITRTEKLSARGTYVLRTSQTEVTDASCVAFSSCGRFLACGYGNGTLRKWDFATSQPALSDMHEVHTRSVNTMAWAASGLLASGSSDRTIVLWQKSRNSLKTLPSHCGSVASIAFSPDDNILASCGFHDEVVLWDIRLPSAAKVLRRIAGCIPYVNSVAFARDPGGKLLLFAALGDKSARVWDLPVRANSSLPPRPRFLLRGEDDHVLCLGVSQDAGVVATGSSKKQLLMWKVKASTSNLFAASPTVEIASGTPGHPAVNLLNGHTESITLRALNSPLGAPTLAGNRNGAAGSGHGDPTHFAKRGSLNSREIQRWVIKTARFKVCELIGVGSTGNVYRGLLNDTTTVAVKRYTHDRALAAAHGVQTAELIGNHPYLSEHTLQVYGACERLEHVLFEYSVHGSIDRYIGRIRYKASLVAGFDSNKQTFLADDLKWKWTRAIADGLAALHSAGLIHGNLRPSKVILRNVEKPVLGCTGLRHDLSGRVGEGRLNFQAPEVLTGQQESSPYSDSWSFGMIMYYIWSEGMMPYADVQTVDELRKLVGQKLKLPPYARMKLSKTSTEILHIMRRCLCAEQKQRPIAVEIRELVKRAYQASRGRQSQRNARSAAAGMDVEENFAQFPSTPIDVDNDVDVQEGSQDVHKSVPMRGTATLGTPVDPESATTSQPPGSPLARAPEVPSILERRATINAMESVPVAESSSTMLVASPIGATDQRAVVGQLRLEPGGNESEAEEPAAFDVAEGAIVATRKADKLPNHDDGNVGAITPLVTASTSEENTLHRKRRRLSDTDETLSALRALELSKNDELLRSWAGRLENDGVDTLGDLNEVMAHHKGKQAAIDWLQSIEIPIAASVKLCRYYY